MHFVLTRALITTGLRGKIATRRAAKLRSCCLARSEESTQEVFWVTENWTGE